MLKCKGCGADIPFIPESQNYICPYCDTVHTHEELTAQEQAGETLAEEHVVYTPEHNTSDTMKVYIYTCPECGGELLTTEETYATFCSYCGSSVLLNVREGKEIKPDYIIPFQITREQAMDIYQKRMGAALFAPSYMRHMDIEKVRGIYMPYWTYDAEIEGHVNGEIEIRKSRPGGTQIDTYQVDADVSMKGDGMEYDSSSAFPDDLSQAAAPYHFAKAKRFSASYMSGFYADRGDVAADVYSDDALNTLLRLGQEDIEAKTKINKKNQHFNIRKNVSAEKAMYPVWFICARNRSAKKVSYAVINGETGKMAADIPTDPLKLLLGTVLLAVPLFLFLYLLVVPTPLVTSIVTMLMALIGIGITGVATYFTKQKFIFSIILNCLSILICLALSIINPFQDQYYYIGIGLADLLCALSYIIIFVKNNKNMLRALPQLGKRGGDERA